jgi:tetratricopeptide (TPR) repeat protein
LPYLSGGTTIVWFPRPARDPHPKMTTTEHHLELARQSFAARDFAATIGHLGEALFTDPLDGAAQQAAYYVLPQLPDPLGLTAVDDQSPPARVAVHAMALALSHDFTQAIELLCRLALGDPTKPYLSWVEQWLAHHPAAVLLEFRRVGPLLGKLPDAFAEPIGPDDPSWETLRAATAVVKKLAETFSDRPSLRALQAKLLRRGKRYDEALALAEATKEDDPRLGALLAAWSLREMGRLDEAIAAFEEAHSLDEDDDIIIDIGDLQLDNGRFEQALQTYRRLAQGSERLPWAIASHAAASFLATSDPAHDLELRQLAEQGNPRAKELYDLLHAFAEALPNPRDLTCDIVQSVQRSFASQPGQGSPHEPAVLAISVTSIESPSTSLALAAAAALHQSYVRLDVTAEKVASPDPRWPLLMALGSAGDVVYEQFPLWRYDGTRPVPGAPPPPAGIVEVVARLASSPFEWRAWQERAAQAGPSLVAYLPGLLSALVHPPPPPAATLDASQWVFRYQVAGALLLGRLDDGWGESQRRRGLFALAHGPIDWLVSAALPALGLVFAEEPSSRGEIWQLFEHLARRIPDIGYCCYRAPLAATTMRLPGLDPALRGAAFVRLVEATRKPFRG